MRRTKIFTRRMRKGFTLVELLIVITIIAALSATISMASEDSIAKARATKIISDFRTIGATLSVYLLDSKDVSPTATYFENHSDD